MQNGEKRVVGRERTTTKSTNVLHQNKSNSVKLSSLYIVCMYLAEKTTGKEEKKNEWKKLNHLHLYIHFLQVLHTSIPYLSTPPHTSICISIYLNIFNVLFSSASSCSTQNNVREIQNRRNFYFDFDFFVPFRSVYFLIHRFKLSESSSALCRG